MQTSNDNEGADFPLTTNQEAVQLAQVAALEREEEIGNKGEMISNASGQLYQNVARGNSALVTGATLCSEQLRYKLEVAAIDREAESDVASEDNLQLEGHDDHEQLQEENEGQLQQFLNNDEEDEEAEEENLMVDQINEAQVTQVVMKPISDKFFYKEMAKIKEKSRTTGAGIMPPKKSASAYIIFQKEKRPEILAVNPKAKVTEVVKEIARCWSLLNKEDRLVYKTEAKRDKERYERELKLLEKQSDTIKKPKKCLSAYMIFVKETRPKIVLANLNMGALQVMQEVGRAWQSMTDFDRIYFKGKADNDKHRYLAESRRFYDEVARIGQQNADKVAENYAASGPKNGDGLALGKGAKGKAPIAMPDKAIELIPVSKLQRLAGAEDNVSGHKRLAVAGKKRGPLARSASMCANDRKRAAVNMAIGLAPDGDHFLDPAEAHAQARLRAESKFTFRPDNLSDDENELSPYQNVELDGRANEIDEQEEDDGPSYGLLGESQRRPETALQFFEREIRPTLERDFSELKNSLLRQVIKQRWDELSLKQKAPFESLSSQEAAKRDEYIRRANAKGGLAARRGAKAAQKGSGLLESPIATSASLTRTNQRIAREALEISDEMASRLIETIEKVKRNQQHFQLDGVQQTQQDHQNQNQQQLNVQNGHNFDDGNQGKSLELDMPGVNHSALLEMEAFGLTKGVWPGTSRNLLGNQQLQMGQQGGAGLHSQSFAAQQAAAIAALAFQGQYLNPLGLTNNAPIGLQGQQQNQPGSNNQHIGMLLGHQNSGEDLSNALNQVTGNNAMAGNDMMQHQLLQQMTAGSSQQQQQQHQLNQHMLMILAQQGMLNNNLLLNQQAALQQLQQPQHALLNQNLMANLLGNKMATLGGNGQGQLSALDILSNQHQLLGGTAKNETPQFAAEIIGDNLADFQSTMPIAATQPITNIFNPTPDLENNINFSNLSLLQNFNNLNAAQATPVTQAALNGLHNANFSDFVLPASVQPSVFTSLVGGDTSTNAQQQLFQQDTSHNNKGMIKNNNHSQLKCSPQISPQLVPLTGGAAEHLNHDQSQQFLNWQQQMLPKQGGNGSNSMQKICSSANMLMSGQLLGQSNTTNKNNAMGTGFLPQQSQLQQQVTPSSMTFISSHKDHTQQQHQQLHGISGNGPSTPLAGTSHQLDQQQQQQLNSTCVTPFLKPTARPHDLPIQQHNAALSSPFLKASFQPQGGLQQNFNIGALLGPPQQAQISPMNNNTALGFPSAQQSQGAQSQQPGLQSFSTQQPTQQQHQF